MRGDHAARVIDERAVGVRLVCQHIEAGTADARLAAAGDVLVERGHERVLVDDGAARGVHQKRGGLHDFELVRADELFGLGDQRAVDAHHVGDGEQLVEGLHLLAAGSGERLGRFGGGPHHDAHAERLRDGRHGLRDAPKEDKAQDLALRAMRGVAVHRVPLAGLHMAVREGDLSHEVEHEAHGVLGHVEGAVARAVGGEDAVLGKAGHVDVVEADGHARDELHARPCHGVDGVSEYRTELPDKAFAALELLERGAHERLVRAAHQLDLVTALDGVQDGLGLGRRTVDHVVQNAVCHRYLL